MMRTVVVATALSTLASAACVTLYLRFALQEVEADAAVARYAARTAENQSESALKLAGEVATLVATQPGADAVGSIQAKLDGMRAELDEMQTQIRLLKLTAR
jgi:precorrin-4 methylase